ncbi:MAG TPA: hypothetical protein VMZ71_15245, partial [Gemmataceae bacterium]|nr:hypothetical protein [Gemmataceae bacterium]
KLTLGKTTANQLEVKWEANEERLVVPSLSADLFGGTVGGSLEYPFDARKPGKFDVTFKAVDAAAATALIPDSPVRITGRVTGGVTGTIAPQSAGESRVGDLSVKLASDKLTVQGIPADELVGTATVRKGVVDFSLEGKSLGGSFDVKGSYPGQKKPTPGGGGRNSVHLRGIDLSRLGPALRSESLSALRGRLDLTFDASPDLSTGGGRVLVTGLAWGDADVSREVRGVLLLDDGQLSLRELTGLVAGGQLGVSGRMSLQNPNRNFLAIELRRASAKQLLAPIPSLASEFEGQVSALVRLTFNRELRGEGTVTVHRGKVVGVGVDDLRVPFRVSRSVGGSTELTVREASTRAGSGRLQAEATVLIGHSVFVSAQVRFAGVPIQTVIPSLGENALVGAGRVTGRFDLSGSNVRSADDLNGTLVAAFQGTSPNELPLFQRLVPYLSPLGLTRPFDTGDVRANLSRGVLRVQRLALVSPNAQVFAGGTITTSGRVDLAVTAHTGQIGPGTAALRLFGLRLPAIGPIPLGLIAEVSAFLSNRTLRMEITGTTDSPVVRVNTRSLLTDEAVRFFLGRYVVPAEATGVFGAGAGALMGSGIPQTGTGGR